MLNLWRQNPNAMSNPDPNPNANVISNLWRQNPNPKSNPNPNPKGYAQFMAAKFKPYVKP